MDIFKGENLIEFTERFKTDLDCKKYLSELKWADGYSCKKCRHGKCQTRVDYSRVCNICSHIESPTAGTLFHKVKFGLKKAFFISFEVSATTKSISANQCSRRYGISYKTAWLFMHKLRVAMKSSCSSKMDGDVHVDEFVVGGKENGVLGRSYHTKKKKIVCAVQLTADQKVKRVYALQIPDYSSKSLKTIFDKHISGEAKVTTDLWKGYKPLMGSFSIEQIKSNGGLNFKSLHIIIHQIKSWLRTMYSWVHKKHIDSYLNEYCYRINRSIFKETIFHKLIERVVIAEPVTYEKIVSA